MTVCSPSEYLWVTLVVPLSVLVTVVPIAGLGILDGVTFLDLRQRHLLYCVFRTHYSPGSSPVFSRGGGSVGVASE